MRNAVPGFFVLALAFASPATADECSKPLSLVASVDMVPVKDDRAVLIPVTLNGKAKLLLVDTGGALTEMSPEVATELALPRQRTAMQLYDVSGLMSDQYVHSNVQLGRLTSDDMAFMVAPPGQTFFAEDTRVAGLLAPDVLRHYDVDIDFGTHKFNLLSQDHCEGKVVYWKADAVAVVPMKVMASGHIFLTVLLDGKEVTAMLDTGAYNTTLTQPIAESEFGLKAVDLEKTGTLPGRDGAPTFHHVFKTLGFEGIAVSNADVDIIPDFDKPIERQNATPETGSHLADRRADETAQSMLLGMDILRHFHIYIAYKEERLYITPK
jgi:predicted aspartyl protease